jgi:predicted enzyme related to lactoylglutathione lyase
VPVAIAAARRDPQESKEMQMSTTEGAVPSENAGAGGNPQIGIAVRDLDSMSRFYGEAVGLPHLSDRTWDGGIMRKFACASAVLKLVRLNDVPEPANPPGGVDGGTGIRYITIAVDDIEERAQRCLAAGAKTVYPIQKADTGATFTILEDPEGNWLELAVPAT